MKVYVVEKVTGYDDKIEDCQVFGVFSTKEKARACKLALVRKIEELDEPESFVCLTEMELDKVTEAFKDYIDL